MHFSLIQSSIIQFYSPIRTKINVKMGTNKSISHGKLYKMHFPTYFTLQGTLIKLNTLRKVEDHENHVRWIYLTTVLYMGDSQKYAKSSPEMVGSL